jgi:DNA polymerase III subunit epsilon
MHGKSDKTMLPKNLTFTAIDFETANWQKTSACQLGLTIVEEGIIKETLSFLIKPEPFFFAHRHIAIHGITQDQVLNQKTFVELWPEIQLYIDHKILVAHNMSFDKSVLLSLFENYQIENKVVDFFCTLYMSRVYLNHLPDHRLPTIVEHLFNEEIQHHNAFDDALASARIAIELSSREGVPDFNAMTAAFYELPRSERRVYKKEPPITSIVQEEAYNGCNQLSGEEFCFTGDITGFTRADAWQYVVNHGGRINNSMSNRTTVLVVGGYNGAFIDGQISSKHKKANEMLQLGKKIRIISDEDFLEMTRNIV